MNPLTMPVIPICFGEFRHSTAGNLSLSTGQFSNRGRIRYQIDGLRFSSAVPKI